MFLLRFNCKKFGRLVLLLGVAVLLVLVLPAGVWPFCMGLLLICAGLSLVRR